MTTASVTATLNLGFLTVLQEANGFVGGYMVTNQWGRPLEFRLSTAVQPNRVQKILYAKTLVPYICSDLIGKALFDKTGTPVQLLLTDTQDCLDLRQRLEIPVACIPRREGADQRNTIFTTNSTIPERALLVRDGIYCHSLFSQDIETINALLDRLIGMIDLSEPFSRVREAVGEARKMGVGTRG